MVAGYDKPWLCHPYGDDGRVECHTATQVMDCKYEEEPVYFTDCVVSSDEQVPVLGATAIIS